MARARTTPDAPADSAWDATPPNWRATSTVRSSRAQSPCGLLITSGSRQVLPQGGEAAGDHGALAHDVEFRHAVGRLGIGARNGGTAGALHGAAKRLLGVL